jgi:hypothetical protein
MSGIHFLLTEQTRRQTAHTLSFGSRRWAGLNLPVTEREHDATAGRAGLRQTIALPAGGF